MPAEYRIDRSKRLIHSRAWGVMTDQDLVANRTALFADPGFSPDFDQLYDLSEVTEVKVSSTVLLHLAMSSRFSPLARRAVVVTSDVAYGMARMYAMLTGHEDTIQVFRDRPSAVQWLEASPG